MPFTFVLPANYGYTALIALNAIPLLLWGQGAISTSLRKQAAVPYPQHYATPEQAKSNPAAYKFNCAQRAHANLMENAPQVMAQLLFAGIEYPNATAILGTVWLVSRILFAYGYIQSDKPNGRGRMIGAGFWLVQLVLLGLCGATAIRLI
ncbi:hypothetical protein LTR66_016310 [Elasticomyces elasticus]|nr:hypothetical protein LTR66_016310 [Elasticomyces elasticus]